MGKKRKISDDQIIKYFKDGWALSIKNVGKKYQYIVLRKGKDIVSLGAYDYSYFSHVMLLDQKLSLNIDDSTKKSEDNLPSESGIKKETVHSLHRVQITLRERLKDERANVKTRFCKHIEDGFCTMWEYDTTTPTFNYHKQTILDGIEAFRKVSSYGPGGWILRVTSDYCRDCNLFTPSGEKYSEVYYHLNLKDDE